MSFNISTAILQQTDIMRASLPEDVGGTNRSFLERVILAQEFVRAWPSLAVTVDSHNIVVEIIARQGAPWMIDRYVPGGISGELIMGDMMSEPEAGSDTRNLKTRAELRDGHYVVNGTKMWTTNGVWAHVAILTAVVDEDAYRRKPSEWGRPPAHGQVEGRLGGQRPADHRAQGRDHGEDPFP